MSAISQFSSQKMRLVISSHTCGSVFSSSHLLSVCLSVCLSVSSKSKSKSVSREMSGYTLHTGKQETTLTCAYTLYHTYVRYSSAIFLNTTVRAGCKDEWITEREDTVFRSAVSYTHLTLPTTPYV